MQHLVNMRRRLRAPLLAAGCILAARAAVAAPDAAGRWEGVADIPGHPLRLVVDLDHDHDTPARWAGSVILPDRGVKGAPLDALAVSGCDVRFGLAAAFAGGGGAAPQVALACAADGTLAGSFALGAQSAHVTLRRTGAPQVDRPRPNSVISAALAGRWTGRYELGGYPREVTLTLANRAMDGAAGQLVIVGKRTTTLDVDQVTQGREFVTLFASAAGLRIEGRFGPDDGVIDGAIDQGPFEAPIVLRRQADSQEKAS
ncbi:MAG: hypothetical protein ABIR54_07465 [Burkholderiaceae bacterium]